MQMRAMLRDRNFRDHAVERLAKLSLLTAAGGFVSVHPLIAIVAQAAIDDHAPWFEVGVGLFLRASPDAGLDDPMPGLDENLGAAAHVAATALEHDFHGIAPITLAMLLCQRLTLVGPEKPRHAADGRRSS
ncbi:hypothetical protein KHQ06_33375 [Nocardia tengchongensis]|uniref:Uncharacterized protein n=1 Tax=Nocardia tengchongensis TaxID=2055889 RepID=A0ABX8CPW0_9NOCA|nr:hypothetical protein [Nocardia tengchongensis]QVI20919.1 hypothetical protein KHQ06_33375 [Nocardia tengchongensis]